MKVLHISAGNMYGGVETLLVTIARRRELCPQMEPSYAVCFDGRLSRELATTGVPVYILGATRVSRPWTVRQSRHRLRKLLSEKRFDVVVCHMPWSHAIFGPEVKKAGVPLVYWEHGPATGRRWLEAWARRTSPSLAICNSNFTAEAVRLLFSEVPIKVIYYPIDRPPNSDRVAARSSLGIPQNQIVIVQVSRMEPWKGHPTHLQALALLNDVPDWVCWMVGGAQQTVERQYFLGLQKQAARLGIAHRVKFLGQRSDVSQILAAADIFCQPNKKPEPFGIVFIEALWAGLPIVATDFGGASEIINDSCGRLAVPGDASSVSALLRTLIESPALRIAIGQAGPKRAEVLCDPMMRLKQLCETFVGCIS